MVDPVYVALGAKIRAKREAIGMSQEVLSSRVGLSRTSVTNIELGRQSVLVHQLIEFANALGSNVSDLIPKSAAVNDPRVNVEDSEEVANLLEMLNIPVRRS